MPFPNKQRSNSSLKCMAILLLAAPFAGCVSEETHNRKIKELQTSCWNEKTAMEANHRQATEAKDKQYQQALSVKDSSYQQSITAKEDGFKGALAAKDDELRRAREACALAMQRRDEELTRIKEEAQKATLNALGEGYRRGIHGVSLEETLEPPSEAIEWLVLISMGLTNLLLATGLYVLIRDKEGWLIAGKAINILVGVYFAMHLARPDLTDISFRQGLVNNMAVEEILLASGFLLAGAVTWLKKNGRSLWLVSLGIVVVTIALTQFIAYTLNAGLIIAVLRPITALQVLSAPLVGGTLWFAFYTCYRKGILEKTGPVYDMKLPEYRKPPRSIVEP